MLTRPSLITLGVQDLERSIKFYRDGLGWKTNAKVEDGVAFFELDNIVLALFGRSALAEDAKVKDDGGNFHAMSLAFNVASKAEVDATFDFMVKAGATPVKNPEDVFWGGYSSYVADPDGHLWEIAWNPFWKMDASGKITLG
jgi:catechol 2,3-dioxygenase-like lactoylglutathione lyase family enzyme